MRLIDADKLIEKLNNTSMDVELWTSMTPNEILKVIIETHLAHVIKTVNAQPTAHDVDVVLAELNNLAMWREVLIYPLDYREITILEKVVEIVKRGGRNE